MLIELSPPEIRVIRSLIVRDQTDGKMTDWRMRGESQQCKEALMLKLYAALEECERLHLRYIQPNLS